MKRCLGDQMLWAASEGEASREALAHITSCDLCATRLRCLEVDLHRLTAVLRAPPPQSTPIPLWPARVPWLPAAAALAAVLIVLWVGLWQQSWYSTPAMESAQEPVWFSIDGVAAALFASPDGEMGGTSAALTDLDDLQAALVGDWPCDDRVLFGDVACADETPPLLFGGP